MGRGQASGERQPQGENNSPPPQGSALYLDCSETKGFPLAERTFHFPEDFTDCRTSLALIQAKKHSSFPDGLVVV